MGDKLPIYPSRRIVTIAREADGWGVLHACMLKARCGRGGVANGNAQNQVSIGRVVYVWTDGRGRDFKLKIATLRW